jgi:hypothetical protein
MRLHRKWRERWYALKDAFNVVAIVVLIAFAIGAIVLLFVDFDTRP